MGNMLKNEMEDDELFEYEGVNKIYYMFELVGIYESYLQEEEKDIFEKYYAKKFNNSKYHYRNMGVQQIYRNMVKNDNADTRHKYNMSKKKMRKYGITHKYHFVYVYLGWDRVTDELTEYIDTYKDVKSVYEKYIKVVGNEAEKYMTFQCKCIDKYCSTYPISNSKRRFIELKSNIQESIQKLNL